jgi:hypothetical protein
MRNNLIFGGISESRFEKNEETEAKLRSFMHEKLQIANDVVENLKFERVHRIGESLPDKTRKIVCKFNMFPEREMVRRQRVNLEGTPYFLHEQFPPEVVKKRKKLLPKLKEAKQEGKRAWISYDSLYIDGRQVEL